MDARKNEEMKKNTIGDRNCLFNLSKGETRVSLLPPEKLLIQNEQVREDKKIEIKECHLLIQSISQTLRNSIFSGRGHEVLFIKKIQDNVEITPERKFILFAKHQIPALYQHVANTHCYAHFKDNYFLVLKCDNETKNKVFFDCYKITKEEKLVYCKRWHTIGSRQYECKKIEKIFTMPTEIICVQTENQMDCWRHQKDTLNLEWSYQFKINSKIDFLYLLFYKYSIQCLSPVSKNEVICQAIIKQVNNEIHLKTYPSLFFKWNLKEKCVTNMKAFSEDLCIYDFVNICQTSQIKIKELSLFLINVSSEKWAILDVDTTHVIQSFTQESWERILGMTPENDLVILSNDHIEILQLPQLKAYIHLIREKNNLIKNMIKESLPYECQAVSNMILEYLPSMLCTPKDKAADDFNALTQAGFFKPLKENVSLELNVTSMASHFTTHQKFR